MARTMIFFLVFLVLLAPPATVGRESGPRVVEQGPDIDGRLDDPAWQAVAAFTAFLMADPQPGAEPSEMTELRIVY